MVGIFAWWQLFLIYLVGLYATVFVVSFLNRRRLNDSQKRGDALWALVPFALAWPVVLVGVTVAAVVYLVGFIPLRLALEVSNAGRRFEPISLRSWFRRSDVIRSKSA